MSKGRNTVVIRARIPDDVYTIIRQEADKKGVVVGTYLRGLLTKFASRLSNASSVDTMEAHSVDTSHSVNTMERIPLYNSAVHKAGDRVLVRHGKQLVETIVPDLDGDGHTIPKVF